MYRAAAVSAGTAPTTRFVFSRALPLDVAEELEPPQAARANGRRPGGGRETRKVHPRRVGNPGLVPSTLADLL
jgi:hypothetical protein